MCVVDSGAPAPDFPIGSACCWTQRALSVSGAALTGLGLGHEGTSPSLAMSGASSVTPYVAACIEPSVREFATTMDRRALVWLRLGRRPQRVPAAGFPHPLGNGQSD